MVKFVLPALLQHLKYFKWDKFSMEPIIFILVFSHSLSGTIIKHEVIYQACRIILHYNESDCVQLGTKNVTGDLQNIETAVQHYVTNLFMMRTLLESIIPAIIGIFIGSWSDRYGRKPLLVISMIGFSFTYLIAAVICQISRYVPINPWYYLLAVLPHSVLGGNCVFSVAVFCIISDTTDTKSRPYRMISYEVFLSIGLTAGSLLSSFVYDATNSTITFTISGLLMCLITIYIVIFIPESLALTEKPKAKVESACNDLDITKDTKATYTMKSEFHSNKIEANFQVIPLGNNDEINTRKKDVELKINKQDKHVDCKESKAGLFSYQHITDMWITCFKQRPHYDRAIILLVTGTMFIFLFVWDGVLTIFYLFVREKFQWSIREFTLYETINYIISIFGSLVGFIILRRIFRMSVVTLALLAFFSQVIRDIIQALATEPWHLYLALGVSVFKSIGAAMCRTIISNIVPATDLGKIFSIKNILQNIAPFVAAPLYAEIYKASLNYFPGLFNLCSAFFHLLGFIFMSFVLYFKMKSNDYYKNILK